MDELFVNADIIREYDAEDEELENLFYSCCAEIDEIQNEIKVLKENPNHLQSIQKATIPSCDSSEKSYDNKCICSTLKKEMWKLRMEMVLKNRQIQALELQLYLIRSENDLHKILKRKQLQQFSKAHSNKISELKAEIEQLKMGMLSTKGKECEDEMINEIEEGESDHKEYNLISYKKEIKDEIQEIRNKLLLSLNL